MLNWGLRQFVLLSLIYCIWVLIAGEEVCVCVDQWNGVKCVWLFSITLVMGLYSCCTREAMLRLGMYVLW